MQIVTREIKSKVWIDEGSNREEVQRVLGKSWEGGREEDIDKYSGRKYSGYIHVDIHHNSILFNFVQTS